MNKDEKIFLQIMIFTILILILVIGIIIYSLIKRHFIILKFILVLIIAIGGIISGLSITLLIMICKILNNKQISINSYKYVKKMLFLVVPLLLAFSKVVKIDSNAIRRVFVKINNLMIKAKNIKVSNSEILILIPHCLQYSECIYKITNNIDNCRMCGRCNIKDFLDIKEKFKIQVAVATGGTLARSWVKKLKPKVIIAVACERDLTSGILDVKDIPVIGVFNERPNGPCFNTKVNTEKIILSINSILKEE